MSTNRILDLLAPDERRGLLRDSVTIALPRTKQLYKSGGPIDAVYFPLDCVISLVVTADQGAVEMATIGNEGVVGASSILNPAKAIGNTVVQVAGEAERVSVAAFHEYLKTSPSTDRLIRKYLYAFIYQIVHAGACNQVHTIQERCARWLLMTHDRKGEQTFHLTQEYLSEMLGVRRATVNLALGALKCAGLIQYVRGEITIINRSGLEMAACSCYALIRQEYEDLRLHNPR